MLAWPAPFFSLCFWSDGDSPLSWDLWPIASVARAYSRQLFLRMRFSLVRQLGHTTCGNSPFFACWPASESEESGRLQAPTSPKLGQKTAAKWARDLCKPATTSDFSSPPP